MKLKRKFERETECPNCGALIILFEKDIKVGRDDILCRKYFYVICINCNEKIIINKYNIPKQILDKLNRQYIKYLNNINSIE
jgi:DNA-directed RNA polymerase subunit RPC12/RpoP